MKESTPNEPRDGRSRYSTKRGLFLALALILLLVAGGRSLRGIFIPAHKDHAEGTKTEQAKSGVAKTADKYTCAMHPQIISDKPGSCPICGMDLVKIEAAPPGKTTAGLATPSAPAASAPPAKNELEDLFSEPKAATPSKPAKERTILFYRNPMDPTITSPKPAKDEMGMEYVPVYSDEIPPTAGESSTVTSAPNPGVEGLATIRVGEEALKLSGVQTAQARQETVKHTVRTVGIVVPDETLVRHVHTKVKGWIESLSTNFTGQNVKQGDPLLSIYSPELLATQEEFLSAKKAAANLAKSASPAVKAMGQELLKSARQRLELFDVPQKFIDQLEKSGTPKRDVTLEAPISGFVTAKGVYEGQQVEPGMELFTITDLSHVWIEADLYEYEAGLVKVGQEATLTLAYEPGTSFKGTVAYVYPYLSPESRTLKVRFDFPNPTLTLKPQMYVNVSLALAQAPGVTIPDSAVIDTGVRQVVFVETAAGTFEPRQVKVGVRGGGKVQIVSGIKDGEQVVVKANFLLDSESRLRAALNKVVGGNGK
jgi:Cu(I)/Ag(I) efflux system membrane fusion protein